MVTKTKIGKIAKPTLKPYIKRFANKYKLSKTMNNLCLIVNFYFIEENWWRNWYLKNVTMETVKHFEIVFFYVFLISRNGKLLDFASVSISMKCTFIYEDWHPLIWEQGQKMEKKTLKNWRWFWCALTPDFKEFWQLFLLHLELGKNIPEFSLYMYTTKRFVMQHRSVVSMEIKVA